ncbi:uncharacterized protein TNCV_1632291 [Trichonephila clavipes]|nr:uncharacterized protein TNCV_1632291 [Trichonephila clavipes]
MFNNYQGAWSVHAPDSIILGVMNLLNRKELLISEKESLPALTCGPSQKLSASPELVPWVLFSVEQMVFVTPTTTGKFKKDELKSIADELKLVVPDNAKVLDLRELIQESEIYKNDKETYQAIVDCVLEEINDRRNEDENRRNENENRLEIEKIKLSHVKTCCAKNCFCGKPHNPLIHFLKRDKESIALNQTVQRSVLNPLADVFGGPGGSNCVVPPQGENEENKSFVATSFLKNKTRTVLLSSVQCFLRDKYGLLHEVRALLDVGSQSHFITKDCADRLQLKNEKINLLVSCLNESTMTINGGVTTSIVNGDLSFKKELNLLVVRRITDLTPSQIINVSLDMPNEIKLADYKFNIPGKIDVLLGAEIFYELLRPGQIYCGDSRLLLQILFLDM